MPLTNTSHAAAPTMQAFTVKDFLWADGYLPRKYEKVVVATINRIRHEVPGCQQLDTSSVALRDDRTTPVRRFFVWCSDDPPGPQSFKVIFDSTGRLLRHER